MDECASFPNVEYIIKHDYIADICRLKSLPLSKYIIVFITLLPVHMNTLMIDIHQCAYYPYVDYIITHDNIADRDG